MIHFWDQPPPYWGSGNGFLAHHYAMLGDQAHAMLYLERQFDKHDFALAAGLSDPALDQLRGSPQFRDLVRRMGLPPSVSRAPRDLPEPEPAGAR
jgi:hypothetical protein